jgi:hypothetical protein
MQEENTNEENQNIKEGIVLTEEKKEVAENNNEGCHQEEGNTKLKLVTLFIVAVLVGVVIKTQAVKTITMGFDDYRVDSFQGDFDLSKEFPIQDQQQTQGEEAIPLNESESSVSDYEE